MDADGYLFDTNILSEIIKRPHSPLAGRIAALPPDAVRTSIVVACELRYGAGKKGSALLSQRVHELLDRIQVLPLEPDTDQRYAEIRGALERAGQPIGGNDLLIAAQALALDLTLVTANIGEFRRISGLRLENWLEPSV